MDKYLESRGIQRETTAPYTPEQNGKAERDNRTIIESARTMLLAKRLPLTLWAEAASTAVYIMNRTGNSAAGNITPYALWIGKKPNLKHLRIFGSEAYMHVPKQLTTKFDARAKRMILVGYERESTNYRLYDPISKKVQTSRDVIFTERTGKIILNENDIENEEIILPKVEKVNIDPENELDNNEENESEGEESFAEARENIYEEQIGEEAAYQENLGRNLRNRDNIKKPLRYQVNVAEINVPETYQEAVTSKESEQWEQAISSELKAHHVNKTWLIGKKSPGIKTIDSK